MAEEEEVVYLLLNLRKLSFDIKSFNGSFKSLTIFSALKTVAVIIL